MIRRQNETIDERVRVVRRCNDGTTKPISSGCRHGTARHGSADERSAAPSACAVCCGFDGGGDSARCLMAQSARAAHPAHESVRRPGVRSQCNVSQQDTGIQPAAAAAARSVSPVCYCCMLSLSLLFACWRALAIYTCVMYT